VIVSTSSGKKFGGLARYLVVGRSGVEVDRVDWATSRNLPTDDPELAARLMEATAHQSLRVQKPVYHVSLSFDPTDRVQRQQVEQVADRLLRALELQEHQAVLVAHRDREHTHVHIVVNRVHPDTGLAWERWQDRPRIEKELRTMERELGLRQVPGRLYREIGIEPPERSLRTPGEHRTLTRADGPLFSDRVRELAPELRAAQSWSELEERLQTHGLRLEPKGQGLVITDGTDHVKASRVARDLSLNRLEQRFETPYPGLGPRQPGREIDPAVRSIVRDVRLHEEVSKHRREFDMASAAASDASNRVQSIRLAVDDWQRELEHLRSQVRGVYVDPAAARDAILTHLASEGLERTVATLREQPGLFGTLHAVERKAALGLITVRDTTQAERSAHHVADDVKRLHESETRLRDLLGITEPTLARPAIDRAVQHADGLYQQASSRVDDLRKAGERLPSLATVERAITDLAQALEPRELRTLRLFLTHPGALLVAKLRGVAMELALGHEHGIER
jgi:Relaxase/Mobilisation nuclease domain